jgi:hypothetical protein
VKVASNAACLADATAHSRQLHSLPRPLSSLQAPRPTLVGPAAQHAIRPWPLLPLPQALGFSGTAALLTQPDAALYTAVRKAMLPAFSPLAVR